MLLYYATSSDPDTVRDILTNGIPPEDSSDDLVTLSDNTSLACRVALCDVSDDDDIADIAVYSVDLPTNEIIYPVWYKNDHPLEGLLFYGHKGAIPPERIDKNVLYIKTRPTDYNKPRTPEEYQANIDAKEQVIIDNLGEAGALEAISKALSYDQKNDIYDYIIRCHDLEGVEE